LVGGCHIKKTQLIPHHSDSRRAQTLSPNVANTTQSALRNHQSSVPSDNSFPFSVPCYSKKIAYDAREFVAFSFFFLLFSFFFSLCYSLFSFSISMAQEGVDRRFFQGVSSHAKEGGFFFILAREWVAFRVYKERVGFS
jgi:hypothetical protein